MGFGIWDRGIRIKGLGCGFEVSELWFRVWGLGSRVEGLGFRAQGLGLMIHNVGFRFRVSG